jgi:hypothetical protein
MDLNSSTSPLTSSPAWDAFTSANQSPPTFPAVNGKCQYLGPVVASNRCSCGAEIDIHFCRRQQMNCVKGKIDFEREWDRRIKESRAILSGQLGETPITNRELMTLLAVCESCPLFQSQIQA